VRQSQALGGYRARAVISGIHAVRLAFQGMSDPPCRVCAHRPPFYKRAARGGAYCPVPCGVGSWGRVAGQRGYQLAWSPLPPSAVRKRWGCAWVAWWGRRLT
jgi:hypothetical protein